MTEPVEETCLPIRSEIDVVTARQQGRSMASRLNFSTSDVTAIATAISELARNIVQYAGSGEIALSLIRQGSRRGVTVVARDRGPGIRDIELALQGGYSTSGGLGLGLSGTRRLMDEFEIDSRVGKGTIVTVRKWER